MPCLPLERRFAARMAALFRPPRMAGRNDRRVHTSFFIAAATDSALVPTMICTFCALSLIRRSPGAPCRRFVDLGGVLERQAQAADARIDVGDVGGAADQREVGAMPCPRPKISAIFMRSPP